MLCHGHTIEMDRPITFSARDHQSPPSDWMVKIFCHLGLKWWPIEKMCIPVTSSGYDIRMTYIDIPSWSQLYMSTPVFSTHFFHHLSLAIPESPKYKACRTCRGHCKVPMFYQTFGHLYQDTWHRGSVGGSNCWLNHWLSNFQLGQSLVNHWLNA